MALVGIIDAIQQLMSNHTNERRVRILSNSQYPAVGASLLCSALDPCSPLNVSVILID